MNRKNIIAELKKHNLLGKRGACFPAGLKWEAVKKAKGKKKYIICNASEGEIDVYKDRFVLENYPEEVVDGVKVALKTIDNSKAYIYLKEDYYRKFKKSLEKLTKGLPVTFFKKPDNYICGEETTILNVIEGGREEPRSKPPYPTQSGLWGYPTLVNNVETFYHIAQIAKGRYEGNRFYSIEGDVKNRGVFELPENYPIRKILKETDNWPSFDFFVQSGGGASGEILLPKELSQPVRGIGSIIVYNRKRTDLFVLMRKWAEFFMGGNCDKCTPCREGVYRINEMLKKGKTDKDLLKDIFFVLESTSYCPMGKIVVVPFKGLIDKLL